MGTEHHHGGVIHSHAPAGKMKLAFFLTMAILIVESIGGFISNSLALLSDAGHVLTDIAALGLSWFALHQSRKKPTEDYTFGFQRSGILAAFVNAIMLIVIAIVILYEAIQRFRQPEHVESTWMFISAAVGLAVNLYLGLGMHKDENINVKSAVLHMLGDAAASAGVIVGGIIIRFTGWYLIDPILSVLIALLVAFGAWRIVKKTINILMEGLPEGVELREVRGEIQSIKGILDVHDLHVWSISGEKLALSCHVVVNESKTVGECQKYLKKIKEAMNHFSISHTTVQFEDQEHAHDSEDICVDEA